MERRFTDMTYKGGGLITNFRYLIASANGKDLSAFNPDSARFGHILLASNAFFKVLDIYQTEGKTQVFLLEIPETAVDFFAGATSNLEEEIIQKARANFDKKVTAEPVSELQAQEWKERTGFPIGMNDQGELFFQSKKTQPLPKVPFETVNPEKTSNVKPISEKPWWKFW